MSHGVLGSEASAGHSDTPGYQGLLEQAAHHLGVAATLGYVLLSCVGVVFETLLLRSFRTDFLTYAEPEDFLMAGLRHPIVLLFVALSVLVLFAVLWAGRLGERLSSTYARWRSDASTLRRLLRKAAGVVLVGYYFFLFTLNYARHEAQAIRAGEEPLIRLEFQQHGADPNLLSVEGYVVATTGRYVFFYERGTQKMQVIPIGAVRQLVAPGMRTN
jgi:hypothetical protein